LLSPANLAILVGTLVVWAGSHAFGVGEAVDLVLLVGGVLFLGLAVFDVATELGNFLTVTSSARDDQDLDQAASHLARAIAIVGVAAFVALIAKFAKARRSKATASEPAAPSRASASGKGGPKESTAEPSHQPKKPQGELHSQTQPTGVVGGKPSGSRTLVPKNADAATQRSLVAENKSADLLADAGFKVAQNPKVAGNKNPDYLIEGQRFDCKAPTTDKPRNAWSEMKRSVDAGQADRMVLNLEESPISLDAMKQQLQSYPIDGLREVIVIKNGQVIPFWP
jgi:hypothetical protein